MLKKLLRAPLPEQIVALLEKLEQDPDASHLVRVDSFLDSHQTELTRYEEWVIKRELNKMRNVIRRARTLDDVMRIVINEPTLKEQAEQEWTHAQLGRSTGTISGTLSQHAVAQQISMYPQVYMDTRAIYQSGNLL